MVMITPILKNTRILDGRAYIGLIAFALTLNLEGASLETIILAMVAGVLYVAYSFAINNCFDVDTDSQNPQKHKKNPIASGELGFTAGLVSSAAIGLLGLIFAYFTNEVMFAIYSIMLGLSTFYSVPPRLKARPFLDVLSHGIFFGALPFFFGAYVDNVLSRPELIIGIAIALYSFALEIRNHLGDYESDLKANLKTTPIVLGKERSQQLVFVFSLSAVLLLLYLFSPPFVIGASILVVQREYRIFDATTTVLLLGYLLKAVVV